MLLSYISNAKYSNGKWNSPRSRASRRPAAGPGEWAGRWGELTRPPARSRSPPHSPGQPDPHSHASLLLLLSPGVYILGNIGRCQFGGKYEKGDWKTIEINWRVRRRKRQRWKRNAKWKIKAEKMSDWCICLYWGGGGEYDFLHQNVSRVSFELVLPYLFQLPFLHKKNLSHTYNSFLGAYVGGAHVLLLPRMPFGVGAARVPMLFYAMLVNS